MKPYGLLSDQHCHAWSQFSGVGPDGVNTRLRIILDEMERAAVQVLEAGGDTLVFAGDLFHTRGAIDPEVFNPTHQMIKKILSVGLEIVAIPGNHDLKGKETTEIGNAMQTLGALEGFNVVTEPARVDVAVAMIPWCSTLAELKARIEDLKDRVSFGGTDLILHAGIDGVLSGVPAHGLTPALLAGYGFKRVFAGHYHHHCTFEDDKVVSIGATTHQTYSDIGTKAGFLLVYPDRVEYRASHAPSFVEITGDTDSEDVPMIVDGNYVRVRGMKLTDREVNELRQELLDMGARGVSFQVERVSVTAREGAPIASPTTSLETSVDAFATKHFEDLAPEIVTAIKHRCGDILAEARGTSAE